MGPAIAINDPAARYLQLSNTLHAAAPGIEGESRNRHRSRLIRPERLRPP